jgi:hypothetical protein
MKIALERNEKVGERKKGKERNWETEEQKRNLKKLKIRMNEQRE